MTQIKSGVVSAAILALSLLGSGVQAQDSTPASRLPVTPKQRGTADQVAQSGVPLSALAPNAPERYTVKSGDTLWDLSGMYLTSPWRWPELWGMNKTQIKNPHLIYPGQTLVLVKDGDRARLQIAGEGEPGVGRLEPRDSRHRQRARCDLGDPKQSDCAILVAAIGAGCQRAGRLAADRRNAGRPCVRRPR